MKDFPRWVLALAFFNLIPVLLSVFFLFGGIAPFGTSSHALVRLLLYVCANLLWLVPALTFFFGLDIYRRGWEKWGVLILALGNVLTVIDLLILILH
ncbi:MAG: hypothetical protein IJ553_02530 [Alloprevotella sp.]|nr:hypothetical protein [Alloprevotella sp.]